MMRLNTICSLSHTEQFGNPTTDVNLKRRFIMQFHLKRTQDLSMIPLLFQEIVYNLIVIKALLFIVCHAVALQE